MALVKSEKIASQPLRMCIMRFIYSPHILWVATMAFVYHSWAAQGYEHFPGTFYWENTDKEKRMAYCKDAALCDEESVWFAGGLKTIMWTKALNKWDLMKCSYHGNTFFPVLHLGYLVKACKEGRRNINPYFTGTVMFTTRANKQTHQRLETPF